MLELERSAIAGVCEIKMPRQRDHRGEFLKVYHHAAFEAAGIPFQVREQYFSRSRRDVIRGMHFQVPPADHEKLVFAVSGHVTDVVVDLRRGSATYGQHVAFELSAEAGNAIYIPRGLAHGFVTRSDEATLVYNVSTTYDPTCDKGIRWDSVGFDWKVTSPILSERDKVFPQLADFPSPFA
jgi:dTDP-4-dehydrorhamnose 3,5-epimerase